MGAAEQAALISQYTATSIALKDATVRTVDSMWLGLGSWRDSAVVEWLDKTVPFMNGAFSAMAALTDAYLTALLVDMLGVPVSAGVPAVTYPRPTPPAEVYQRPFSTMRFALSQGRPFPDALQAGRARAVEIATTDLQLAKQKVSKQKLVGQPRVVGYRRVLTGSKSCAMCALAARQRYRKEDLMPMHPGCSCGTAPIIGTADPGQSINAARARDPEALQTGDFEDEGDLGALNAAIARQFGPDAVNASGRGYNDLVLVREHGELGPVLTRRQDSFRGPQDID